MAVPADATIAQQTVCPNDECSADLVRRREADGWGPWLPAVVEDRRDAPFPSGGRHTTSDADRPRR